MDLSLLWFLLSLFNCTSCLTDFWMNLLPMYKRILYWGNYQDQCEAACAWLENHFGTSCFYDPSTAYNLFHYFTLFLYRIYMSIICARTFPPFNSLWIWIGLSSMLTELSSASGLFCLCVFFQLHVLVAVLCACKKGC